MANEKLAAGLSKIGLSLSENQIGQLEKYAQCVLEFNETYNLMKAESVDELVVNHILDSLVAVPHLAEIASKYANPVFADIGSGGGCPGIPLSIAFPQFKFNLVERMDKRCMFLTDTIEKLGIKNAKVINKQADLVKGDSFDIEVFRAFHPFDKKIAKLLLRMLKPNGTIAAYKAREEKITAEMEEVQFIIPSYKKIKLEVPFLEDHERNLVIVEKSGN